MAEIIDLSAMLGDVPEHTYTLAGKELRYPDPTLEQSARLQRLASNLTLTNLVELTREGVRMCAGEGFDEDWFKAITLKESTHFSAFLQNPSAGGSSEAPEPLSVKLRGHSLRLPAVTMGDLEAFPDYLEENEGVLVDELRQFQLETLLARTTLGDGSELPVELDAGRLSKREANALVNLYINGVVEQGKKVPAPPKTTARRKRGTGRR